MLPPQLSLNKNMYGRPVPLTVTDVDYDVWEVLGKCVTYSLINLVYDRQQILFLNEIKSDLTRSINTLLVTDAESPRKPTHGLNLEVIAENRYEVLNLAKFLIGINSHPPMNVDQMIDVLQRRDFSKWQTAVIKMRCEDSKPSEDRKAFTIEGVSMPILYQSGFTINISTLEEIKGVFTYKPNKTPDVVGFITCFKLNDCNIDTYLALIGGLSPIPECFINYKKQGPSAYATARTLYTEAQYLSSNKMPNTFRCEGVLELISNIRSQTHCTIGSLSTRLIDYLKKRGVPVADYLSKVYSGNEEDVVESEQAVYAAYEHYAADQDVLSHLFVSMEADEEEVPEVEEDEEPEEDTTDEDGDDLPEEESDDTPEEPVEDDEGSDDETTDETAEETPAEPAEPSPAEQTSGVEIEIDPTANLDAHIYRKEMRKELTRLINSDESNISISDKSVLKALITYWLHVLTPASINDIVSKVVKVKISYTK